MVVVVNYDVPYCQIVLSVFFNLFFASARGEERRREKWVHVKECPQL